MALHNETGANQTFAIQHIGANLIQQGIDKGGNALGLEAVDQQCECSHFGSLGTTYLATTNTGADFNRVDHTDRLGK